MEYKIVGGSLPAVICDLEANEVMITEGGSMCFMTPNFTLETVGGGVGKIFGRLFSGEKLFLNKYTSLGQKGQIVFSSSLPGVIAPFEITPGKELIVQKTGFLAATNEVEVSIHFRKKIGIGFFGGEGFIMQKIHGSGTAFLEFSGHVEERYLEAGESIMISTGNLAAMDSTCEMDIVRIPGLKNFLFSGEGLFHTVVKGPGRVFIQTMSVADLYSKLRPYVANDIQTNTRVSVE